MRFDPLNRQNLSTPSSRESSTPPLTVGEQLRRQREKRGLSLRELAKAVSLDPTLLNKIELGGRLPTAAHCATLAAFFEIPVGEMEAARIAEKFWRRYAEHPAAERAIERIRETAPIYRTEHASQP